MKQFLITLTFILSMSSTYATSPSLAEEEKPTSDYELVIANIGGIERIRAIHLI